MEQSSHHLETSIQSALNEPNVFRARQALHKVIADGRRLLRKCKPEQEAPVRVAIVSACGHLAATATNQSDRTKYRESGLRICSDGLRSRPTFGVLVLAWSELIVSWAYDSLCPSRRGLTQANLARAWRSCRAALDDPENSELTIALLSQWSSVHRCQAAFYGRPGGFKYIQHALRISESNYVENNESALARLDFGLTLWSAARFARTEDDFYARSQRAEIHLREAHALGASIATLALARFLRQTYRPIQAIEMFREYVKREKYIRVVFPESHIAGEAAIMLIHKEMEDSKRQELLTWVDSLLSNAVEAGYLNARLLLPIARIRFFLGELDTGAYFLGELMPNGDLNWKEVIATAIKAFREENTDMIQSAFALGITDGYIWNSLATLVRDIESDDSFSLTLYDQAIRLSPHSAIIHTNIARVLLERDCLDDTPKIKRHIELAAKYSDFSFRWWIPLRNQFDARRTGRSIPAAGYKVKKDRESINRLYKEFVALEQIDDQPHSRGRAFQDIFLRLLRLTFGIDRTAGSLKLAGMESDASFIHGDIGYRAEVSWDSRPNDRSEVDKLKSRLDRTTGTRGILVSMSGFSKTVFDEINRQRGKVVIFTLGPDEIREVFQGKSRLESLLEEKNNKHFLTSFS